MSPAGKNGSRGNRIVKAVLVVFLCALSLAITIYAHYYLHSEVVFSHLYYVPIVLCGIWFGKIAAMLALGMSVFLVGSHLLAKLPSSVGDDLVRSAMFVTVGFLVGVLWERYQRTEKSLRETRDFLNGLVSSSRVPILLWNEHGSITLFNEAMGALTGFSPQKMIGQPVEVLFRGETRRSLEAALVEDGDVSLELPVRCSDGREAVGLWTPARVLSGESRAPLGVMVQGQDISKRKWGEEMLRQHAVEVQRVNGKLQESERRLTEMVAVRDKLFSILSHDLRSPFTPLLLYTDMLMRGADNFSPEKIREMAQSLHGSARRLFALVENLLEWSRLQAGGVEHSPVDLGVGDSAQEALKVFRDVARSKEIEVSADIPDDCRVVADRQHLACILRNLLSNAVKFTPRGGRVEIVARSTDAGTVELSVRDTGVGMTPDEAGTLFRIEAGRSLPGTENERGSGLGLVLCREMAAKNSGGISVASTPGAGSIFTVTLPASAPGA